MMDGVAFSDVVLTILIGIMGWACPTLFEMKRNIRDLHKWHAPDDTGRQTWKWDVDRLLSRIDNLIALLEKNLK